MSDWYEDVYHASAFPKDSQEYWKRVRYYIIERDGFRCQACRKRGKYNDFNAHHITPRIEGGDEEPSNLITLHELCHDYVEAKGFRMIDRINNSTKFLDKDEMRAVIYHGSGNVPDPVLPPLIEMDEPIETDRAEIICPCGIYHIRKQSLIGSDVVKVDCVCGRSATYEGGDWLWETRCTVPQFKGKRKAKPAGPIEKKHKQKTEQPQLEETEYLYSVVTCPVCHTKIQYYKHGFKYKGVKCSCGCRADYLDGQFRWLVYIASEQEDIYKPKKSEM